MTKRMEGTVLVLRQPTHVMMGISEHLVGEWEPASHQAGGVDGLQYASKVMKMKKKIAYAFAD